MSDISPRRRFLFAQIGGIVISAFGFYVVYDNVADRATAVEVPGRIVASEERCEVTWRTKNQFGKGTDGHSKRMSCDEAVSYQPVSATSDPKIKKGMSLTIDYTHPISKAKETTWTFVADGEARPTTLGSDFPLRYIARNSPWAEAASPELERLKQLMMMAAPAGIFFTLLATRNLRRLPKENA